MQKLFRMSIGSRMYLLLEYAKGDVQGERGISERNTEGERLVERVYPVVDWLIRDQRTECSDCCV
jgi:hypothetical protein